MGKRAARLQQLALPAPSFGRFEAVKSAGGSARCLKSHACVPEYPVRSDSGNFPLIPSGLHFYLAHPLQGLTSTTSEPNISMVNLGTDMKHVQILSRSALLLPLAMTAVSILPLMPASAKDDRATNSPPLAKPITRATVTLSGVHIASLFEGLKPNPKYSLQRIEEHRHLPAKCPAQDESNGLTWLDRFMGVTTVHAQGCTGSYWGSTTYACSVGGGCPGGWLNNTEFDSSNYGGGFTGPIYCPGSGTCGMSYPFCYNGGS